MTCRARYVSRAATLGGALGLLLISSVNDVRTQSAPGRVIWRGINTVSSTGPTCHSQLVQTFEFVGEEVPNTDPKWLSRKVTWDWSEACAADVLVLEATGGATPQRVLRPWTGSCVNTGEADLNLDPNPERRGQCQESPALGNIGNHIYPTLGWTGPRPPEEMRNGCAYASRSRLLGSDGSVHVTTYSVTVSRQQVTAVVEVDRDGYAAFVPEPGKPLTFTARSASGPVRFRFELDRAGTSRFPGYATNANVDEQFFTKYGVERLRGAYANDGPDFVFYPSNFAETEWARIDPAVVETDTPQTSVAVTMTAMDYGAVGQLRAFAQTDECDGLAGWQPVAFQVGTETRESLTLPLDADNNLMADALEPYRGLASGDDVDAEPKGNGMAGDGLTAFEEYRGFLVSSGDCAPTADDYYVRTRPSVKDLFVHTPDPEMEMALAHTAWSSGLGVHPICAHHYSGNPEVDASTLTPTGDLGTRPASRRRVVNRTLQFAGLRQWQGRTLSQEIPQHGLYLIRAGLAGLGGCAFGERVPHCLDTFMGPPMVTSVVAVSNDPELTASNLVSTVTHEIGHSVGMPHHADRVEQWEMVTVRSNRKKGSRIMVVAPGGDCVDPRETPGARWVGNYFYADRKFLGCGTTGIIVRNGQNSGNASCPMRYSYGGFFREAPGTLVPRPRRVDADEEQNSEGDTREYQRGRQLDIYDGRYLEYDYTLDHDALGSFCVIKTGTGLNGLDGDRNHAGDSQVACMDHLVVNDNVLRGIR